MKKIGTLALSLSLGLTSFSGIGMNVAAPILAEEVEEQEKVKIEVENGKLTYELSQTVDDFLKAEKDENFFDGKEKDDPLYNAIKEKIIENARAEEKKYSFEVKVELDKEPDIKKTFDQIIEDMECYLYWSDGNVKYDHYHYEEDNSCYITFTFFDQTGIYTDEDGNSIIPWEKVHKKDHFFTLDELKEKAGDSLVLIMDEDGEHILFVAGNFSDKKVKTKKDLIKAIKEMKKLIGYEDNKIYEISNTSEDVFGNTYYHFSEVVDDTFFENFTQIIVGVNEAGKVVCISAPSYTQIGDKEYEEVTKDFVIDDDVPFMEERGWQFCEEEGMDIEYNETIKQMCYTLIFKNEDGLYAKLYHSLNSDETGTNTDLKQFGSYEEMKKNGSSHQYMIDREAETETMLFTDNFGNTVELPVAYEEGKGYYLLDTERNMVGALWTGKGSWDQYSPIETFYFDSPDQLPPYYVSAFHNMTNSFDTYKKMGLYSDDKPVKLIFQVNATELNAAASFEGDSINIFLNNNPIIASYDVVSHEITHAFNQYISGNLDYKDCTGAMMESYADICGNILEMMANENKFIQNAYVDMDQWFINESQDPIRNMSDPNQFANPYEVFGMYYVINNKNANIYEDYGGVHTNSGILNNIVYRMRTEANMKFEDLIQIFFSSQNLFSNSSTYKTIQGYVGFMMKNLKYDQKTIDQVNGFFEDAGVEKYSPSNTWDTITPVEGLKKTIVLVSGADTIPNETLMFLGSYGEQQAFFSKDLDGKYGIITDKDYDLLLAYITNNQGDAFAAPVLFNSEEDAQKPVHVYDILSSAVSANCKSEELLENVIVTTSTLPEVFKNVVILVPETMSKYNLIVTNLNEESGDAAIYFVAPYLADDGGFDLLLRNDAKYNLSLINSQDPEMESFEVKDFAVEGTDTVELDYQDVFDVNIESSSESTVQESSAPSVETVSVVE